MSVPPSIPSQPVGNPARQADDLNRGITFQIWCSVEAWINLTDDQVIYLEGVEDFDVVSQGGTIGAQVKATAAPVSLRSPAIVDLLVNFWDTRSNNPGKTVQSRLITTSAVTIEDMNPLGARGGIEIWQECAKNKDLALAEKLRAFLSTDSSISQRLDVKDTQTRKAPQPNLQDFLLKAKPEEVLQQLISCIIFHTGSPDAEVVRESIRASLHAYGETQRTRPNECDRALDRLFRVAAETAGKKSQRVLSRDSFRLQFEEATTQRVSPSEMDALRRGGEASAGPSSPADVTMGLGAARELLIQRSPPELPTATLQRTAFTGELGAQLNRNTILVIQGSSGMGKSRLAALVARATNGNWLWADLQGLPSESIPLLLRALAAILAQQPDAKNLALDNLHFTPAELAACEVSLAAITRTARVRGGRVILTTQRQFSTLLQHKLDMPPEAVVKIPRLTVEEIRDFCVMLECPTPELALTHAKLIEVQTSGHPRLVHARLVGLQVAKWPALKFSDNIFTTPEIDEELDLARQLLDQAPGEDKLLLYRLSVAMGPFRRDHAIALGRLAPALGFPADSFDRLVGPWIDKLGSSYFRLSPLLNKAAEANWTKDEINTIRRGLARAMLADPKKTLREAEEVLFQGLLSEDEEIVTTMVVSLTHSKYVETRILAETLSWLPAIGRAKGKRAFPSNTSLNFLLRILQFRILAVQKDARIGSFCAIVDAEFAELGAQLSRECRYMWLSTVLHYNEAMPGERLLVAYWLEAHSLLTTLPAQQGLNRSMVEKSADLPDLPEMDFDGHLWFQIVCRRMSPAGLVGWANAVNAMPAEQQLAVFGYMRKLLFPLRLAIDRAFDEAGDNTPAHWEDVVKQLELFRAAVAGWGISEINSLLARAQVTIHDEHQNRPDLSFKVLEAALARPDRVTYHVEDQLAVLYYRQKKHPEALAIWQRILPAWPVPNRRSSDRSWLYASQRAGHCAGVLDNWPAAIAIFQRAHGFARRTEEKLACATFEADEAHAQWKNGDRPAALRLMASTLGKIEKFQPADHQMALFHRARKCIEQVIKWFRFEAGVRDEPDAWDPPAGFCSRAEGADLFKEFLACPIDLMWFHLADAEQRSAAGDQALDTALARLPASKYALFRGAITQMALKRDFVRRDFSHLLERVAGIVQGVAESDAQMAAGKSVAEADVFVGVSRADATGDMVDAITSALLVLHANSLPLDRFLGDWRKAAAKLLERDTIKPVLTAVQEVLEKPESELADIFGRHKMKVACSAAALRMSARNTLMLEAALAGQAALTWFVSKSTFRRQIEEEFGRLVRDEWRRRITFPAQFPTPRLTVPAIKTVCDDPATGLKLAARILLEVRQATAMPLPAETVEGLRTLARD